MERYLVLKTFGYHGLADKACAALEDLGIPVMLEHVRITDGGMTAFGYRVLVPSQYSQSALKTIDVACARGAHKA